MIAFDGEGNFTLFNELMISREKKEISQLKVFCAATMGIYYISFDAEKSELMTLRIYNDLGEEIYITKLNSSNGDNIVKLDLAFLETGTYQIKLVNDNSTATQNLVIK